ncbi:DHH family phosphoesterase [Candidatus Bipolaricaulota bacterium]|nr:DHH family phosphoesterase [Candidatus Bipolaricaulota bacterium]
MEASDFLNRFNDLDGRVAITVFGNPDPDAIASAFALGRIFDHYGIDFGYLFESEINRPENQLLVNYLEMRIDKLGQQSFDGYKHVSLVDCNPDRVGEERRKNLSSELDNKLLSVQDHHPINEDELGDLKSESAFIDIRPELGSCSTILAECIAESELEFDGHTATGLFYGLHSDTNGLLRSFAPYDVEQLTNYVEQIDMESLKDIVGGLMTSETFEVIHRVTDEDFCEVRGTYKFANAGTLTSKTSSAIPQVADFLLKEEGIEGIVVAGIDLDNNIVLGSVRYSGSRYTAEEIAAKIARGVGSGGGHVEMGGFQIQPGVLSDTINRESTQNALIESVKERFFNVVGKKSDS